MKNSRTGDVIHHDEVREKGRAKVKWLSTQGLTKKSSPSDWMNALLPEKWNPTDPCTMVTITDWTSYRNTQVLLANAEVPRQMYPEF